MSWEPLPRTEQDELFHASGPWLPEWSKVAYRIRNTQTGEVQIAPTPEMARARAADLNAAWADRREHDNRSWTTGETDGD